jgi:hypothetical protein
MRLAAAFILGAMAATVAHAAIQVTYSDLGRFTDRAGGLRTAEAALHSLTERLESLGTSFHPNSTSGSSFSTWTLWVHRTGACCDRPKAVDGPEHLTANPAAI